MNLAYLALLFTWITVFRQMGRQCRKRIKGFACFKCLGTSWSLNQVTSSIVVLLLLAIVAHYRYVAWPLPMQLELVSKQIGLAAWSEQYSI